MPFLIESKLTNPDWTAISATVTRRDADAQLDVLVNAGLQRRNFRITEMDQARIDWRLAAAEAADKFKDYQAANKLAYDLKIKIRSRQAV
jgi:hypothetical protein